MWKLRSQLRSPDFAHNLPLSLVIDPNDVLGSTFALLEALPAEVLDPATRALGMGMFFTLYYGVTLVAPVLGGWLSALTGSTASSFDAALVLVGLCVPLLMLVRRMIAAGPQGQPA